MIKFAAGFLVAAAMLVPTAASAISLSLAGAPGDYTVLTLGPGFDLDTDAYVALTGGAGVKGDDVSVILSGAKDSTNGLSVNGPAKVTFTYLGKEAGFSNSLVLLTGDTELFNSGSTVGTESGPYDMLAGLLSFKLISNDSSHYVFNNDGATSGMNIAYYILEGATSALVFLDDYIVGPDGDYDDIGILVEVAPIPLPPGLALLGAGLGGLGFLGWRKRRVAFKKAQLA